MQLRPCIVTIRLYHWPEDSDPPPNISGPTETTGLKIFSTPDHIPLTTWQIQSLLSVPTQSLDKWNIIIFYILIALLHSCSCRPGVPGAPLPARAILSMGGLSHGVIRVNTEDKNSALTVQDVGHIMPGGEAWPQGPASLKASLGPAIPMRFICVSAWTLTSTGILCRYHSVPDADILLFIVLMLWFFSLQSWCCDSVLYSPDIVIMFLTALI